jgi:DNA (cytosine-5)-methyltransferase 1
MRVVQPTLFDSDAPEVERKAGSFPELCRLLGVGPGPNWPDRFGAALSTWARSTIKTPIRTLSLFSGAGGLDIAFHDAGFQIETAVEIDERFAATLRVNAGQGGYLEGTEVLCQDIRDFHPSAGRKIDFVLGGPPCQSFSAAGRRAAGVQGTQDQRGTLFQEYVRLLKLLEPRAFLFENVYGITGAEQGKAWQSIRRAFQGAGYTITFRILDTADYGVPQHRERMFIVGTRDKPFLFPAPTHGPDSPDRAPHVGAAEAIEGALVTPEERRARIGGRFGHLLEQVPEGLNYSFFTEKMGHPQPIFAWRSKFSDFLYKADPKVPVRTIKAQGGQYTGPFHWENRPFAVSELKRLQTFPDRYALVGRRQVAIHQIGNSVPCQTARVLALAILEQAFGVRLPSRLPPLHDEQELGFRKRKRDLTSVYRSKASRALSGQQVGKKRTARPLEKRHRRVERARLTPDFGWQSPCDDGPFVVQTVVGADGWTVRVDAGESKPLSSRAAFEIILSSQDGCGWALGNQTVKLIGGSLEGGVLVGAWKAFEAELARRNVKADLVQLCEYYQYRPRFSCRMTLGEGGDPRWKVLQQVVEGVGTREILTGQRIARLWGCEETEVVGHMLWLRSLAYEARNRNTNFQIPQGSYLIPYTFPTLNPMSVQVRKSLVPAEERQTLPVRG